MQERRDGLSDYERQMRPDYPCEECGGTDWRLLTLAEAVPEWARGDCTLVGRGIETYWECSRSESLGRTCGYQVVTFPGDDLE